MTEHHAGLPQPLLDPPLRPRRAVARGTESSPEQQQQDDWEAVIEPSARDKEMAEVEEAIKTERGDQNPGDLPRELRKSAPVQPGNYLMLGEPERQPQLAASSDAVMPGRVMKRWEKRKWRKSHGNADA
jgi:hypothetical protein